MTVVVVVQGLCVLAGVFLGLVPVEGVEALGLDQLVDLGADEAGQELLGEGVGDGFAWEQRLLAKLKTGK